MMLLLLVYALARNHTLHCHAPRKRGIQSSDKPTLCKSWITRLRG